MVDMLRTAARELRYALRVLARSPGPSLAVVAVVALGIGASATLYGMGRGVLWPRLVVDAADRLVTLHHRHVEQGYYSSFATPQVDGLAVDLDSLSSIAGYLEGAPVNLGAGDTVARVQAAVVDGGYFATLGLESRLGRLLGEADDRPGAAAVAVLSHGLWRGRFGGDPGVVGSELEVNGHPFRIVGVAPAGFEGADYGAAVRLWVPRAQWRHLLPWMTEELLGGRGAHWLSVVGRLAPGAGIEAVRSEIETVTGRLATVHPETDASWEIVVQDYRRGRVYPGIQEDVYGTLGLLGAVVLLVLLIVCANVANLLLARSPQRAREMAVRRALGARRADLARQSILESLLLAAGGGGVGLLLAAWTVDLLGGVRPVVGDSLVLEPRLDLGVAAVGLLLCLLTGVLFGLPAAWRGSRSGDVARLPTGRAAGRPAAATPSRGGPLDLRNLLAATQVAVCLALVVGSILLVRSLGNLRPREPGFEPRGVLLTAVDLGLSGYEAEAGLAFYRRLQRRLAAMPEVESASLAGAVPLARRRFASDVGAGEERLNSGGNVVGPDYLRTMGIRLLRGREFDAGDAAGAAPVAMVNETLADALWKGRSAVGQVLEVFQGREEPLRAEVVGVVADGVYGRTLESRRRPFFFLPALQRYQPGMVIHVRGRPGAPVAEPVRRTVMELDADVPVYDVRTLSEHLDEYLARPRAMAVHASLFALLALVLAAVGIYGVVSYRVGRRVPEIGIRKAVGAREADISRMVLGQAAVVAAMGIVIGLVVTILVRGAWASLLYGVEPFDAPTFAAAALFLGLVALVAAWLPARRAARLDPTSALRRD